MSSDTGGLLTSGAHPSGETLTDSSVLANPMVFLPDGLDEASLSTEMNNDCSGMGTSSDAQSRPKVPGPACPTVGGYILQR